MDEYKTYLDHLWKKRVTISFAYGIAFFATLMFIARALIEGFNHFSLYLLIAVSALFCICAHYAKKTENFRSLGYLICLCAVILLPMRAAATGGISSMVVVWFALLPPIAVVIIGKPQAIVATVLIVVHFLYLLYSPPQFYHFPKVHVSNTTQIAVIIIGLTLSCVITIMYEQNRVGLNHLLLRAYRKLEDSAEIGLRNEQLETAQRMVKTYNHEINNPLQIAIGNLELYYRKGDQKNLRKVEESLNRISEITKMISESVKEEENQRRIKETQ